MNSLNIKRTRQTLVLFLFLALALSIFYACGSNHPIVGSWHATTDCCDVTFTFNSNRTMHNSSYWRNGSEETITEHRWEIDNNVLRISTDDGEVSVFEFLIDGSILRLTGFGSSVTFTMYRDN